MNKSSTQRSLRTSKKETGGQLVTNEIRDIEKIRNELANLKNGDDPIRVLKDAEEKLMSMGNGNQGILVDNPVFKAMTLREFENGTLLTTIVPSMFATIGIDLMRKIQKEYACVSESEKSIAELASASFVRALDAQGRIKRYLDGGELTGIGVQYLAVMSKELDRANRHYLSAIQTLRSLRQPPMQLNIRTNTAVIGQNQIVQTNENNEPK